MNYKYVPDSFLNYFTLEVIDKYFREKWEARICVVSQYVSNSRDCCKDSGYSSEFLNDF